MSDSIETPSPARSDKDAERPAEIALPGGSKLRYEARTTGEPGWLLYDRNGQLLHGLALADVQIVEATIAATHAAKAQESAPSSEEIATWDARQRASEYGRNAESCMLEEIADLRAALARRATAGNAAPTEPVYFFRQKGTNQWIESEADQRESFADRTVGLCMEYRTLYMNPVASNAGAAPRGISINIDKERARFEAAHPNFALCRSADGPYCAWVEDRWQGWLAAKSEAIP